MPHGSVPADPVLRELKQLWATATAETISHDLDRARSLVGDAEVEARAREYLVALERLERWLHDR